MHSMHFLRAAVCAAALAIVVQAGQIKAVVTAQPMTGYGFDYPLITVGNLSNAGYSISSMAITNGYVDFVFTDPITAPNGGTYTAQGGTQVSNSNMNDGCTPVAFGLTSFDPGDSFAFTIEPEPDSCGNEMYDWSIRLNADQPVASITFTGPGIPGSVTLSGSDWVKESNTLYRLTLSQTVNSVPEPSTVALLSIGLAGLALLRRRA